MEVMEVKTDENENFAKKIQFMLSTKIAVAKVNVRRKVAYTFLKPKQVLALKSAVERDTVAILHSNI